jgi:O-methyltransferase
MQTLQSVRNLYLDLLIRTVANTIYEDPSMDPWHRPTYHGATRAEGRDWPRSAHSMVGTKRLQNIRHLVQATLDEGVPGDYIETGVWRGGACILMRGVLAANAVSDRMVYVADSFEGLPPPKPDAFPADIGDKHHIHKQLAVGIDEVKANFAKYQLLDSQVVFVKGFFEHTLASLEAKSFALIRLDGDMYQSTFEGLEALYPKLSIGGYCVIDDYGAVPGCRRAVEDYVLRENINAKLIEIDWTGVYWQKSPPQSLPRHTPP